MPFSLAAVALVIAAPVPKEPPAPRFVDVRKLIGQDPLGAAFARFAFHLQAGDADALPRFRPKAWGLSDRDDGSDLKASDGFDLDWKDRGLKVLTRKGGIRSVQLYAANGGGYADYPGELPHGLKWGDSVAAAKKKYPGLTTTDERFKMAGTSDEYLRPPGTTAKAAEDEEIEILCDDPTGVQLCFAVRTAGGRSRLCMVWVGVPVKK